MWDWQWNIIAFSIANAQDVQQTRRKSCTIHSFAFRALFMSFFNASLPIYSSRFGLISIAPCPALRHERLGVTSWMEHCTNNRAVVSSRWFPKGMDRIPLFKALKGIHASPRMDEKKIRWSNTRNTTIAISKFWMSNSYSWSNQQVPLLNSVTGE